MKVGKVYEVMPLFQVSILCDTKAGFAFYGKFIGYDSYGKCVFESDGKYIGYWEAGTRDNIFDTAKIIEIDDGIYQDNKRTR